MDNNQLIGVIGSGTMGNGIAHIAALTGYQVLLVDVNSDVLEKAINTISLNLGKQVSKGIISEKNQLDAFKNIKATTDISDVENAYLIIEAVSENKEIKNDIFSKLDSICKSETILASNTSSISITDIAENTNRSDKVIGMHFMNPVPVMKLVEIVNTSKTSVETKNVIINTAKNMGKTPVECNDYPGFVSNRILMPMINESVFCLEQGVATKEAIDDIMTLGMAHPMGPLKLADLIGLDICLNIMHVLFDSFKDKKYKPCDLLEKMVEQGNLGRKTGKGFYNYK